MQKTYNVGDTFTTAKSGVTGVIKEIHQNVSGSARILLDVKGKDRWTTYKPSVEVLSIGVK